MRTPNRIRPVLAPLAAAAILAVAAPMPAIANVTVELVDSGQRTTTVRIRVGTPTLTTVDTPAGQFQRFSALNNGGVRAGDGAVNQPELPIAGFPIALPLEQVDAPQINVQPEGTVRFMNARLYPVQPGEEANAEDRRRAPFTFVQRLYDIGGANPGAPLDRVPMFKGDANLETLRFMPYGYTPANGLLTWHDSYLVTITHAAGDCFAVDRNSDRRIVMDGVDRALESLHRATATRFAINQAALQRTCGDLGLTPTLSGARFVIVTHPDFVAAANTLAAHKEAMGITTRVVRTDDIAGPAATLTATAIRNWLRNYRNNSIVKPKWVLLMGDTEKIPTHYDSQHSGGTSWNAGDIYFGQISTVTSPTAVPVVGVGRFPVDTLTQANTIVNKTIAFELNPPRGPGSANFYNRLTFAAFFEFDPDVFNDRRQDSRWFVENAEIVRNHALSKGQSVERIYKAFAADDPRWFRSGAPYPAALRKPGFAWDGSTADVINAFNAGTSLFFHRDHGSKNGWGDPLFQTFDLNSVSVPGTRYPVVFSINCASGLFDNETVNAHAAGQGLAGLNVEVGTTYWAEAFIRKADGALAIIGDTRNSKTVDNTILAFGLFDAIYPGLAPSFGPSTKIRRMGDVLNHGFAYLAAVAAGTTPNLHPSDQGAVVNVNGLRQQMNIYSLFGDPTVKLRTGEPTVLTLSSMRQVANLVEIAITATPCAQCPEPEVPDFIPVIVIDPLSGRVLGRNVLDRTGRTQVDIGNFRGRFVVRVSSPDGTTIQASNDETDTDRDGVPDSSDNCTAVANGDQKDSDSDGYGDACDADANNDGIVNSIDQAQVRIAFGSRTPTRADLNGDGVVNALDLALVRRLFSTRPGPSAWHR